MNSTFSFTQKRIDTLIPSSNTKTYSDQKLNNLKVTVTSAGTKTYYCRFKHNKQCFNLKIGNAGKISLDDARARAVEVINLHRRQSNTELFDQENNNTLLNDLFQLYLNGELKHRKTIAGRTHGLQVAYDKHIRGTLGKKKFSDITKRVARQFFHELEGKGYSIHNKCLSALKAAINYVIDYEEYLSIKFNPFERIKKMPGVTRNRYLSYEEAGRLLAALKQVSDQDVADIYRVALYTGARLSNVKSMSWNDVNLSSAVWMIPATLTKTRQHYEIPLHDLVIDILSKRQVKNGVDRFVFPSRVKSKHGYITGGDKVWKEAITLAGLYHSNPTLRPRPHDLRRTFATWQIQSGADISVVSKSLCHTSLKHTLIYAHTNVDQVRSAINDAFRSLK